jgi:xanthine/CO dehydrogenase XdhC/CoxF family maturation factor
MNSIVETAGRLLDDHKEFVLATIVSRHGSTPRMAGTRMIIAERGRNMGTVGGGLLEARVAQKAGDVLSSRHAEVLRFERNLIFKALLKQGFTESDLKRVHSPIGLDIGAETPEEIALSIVVKLVKIRAEGQRP